MSSVPRFVPGLGLDDDTVRRLRGSFEHADYTVSAVVDRLGAQAHAALGRNQSTPGRRVLGADHDPLATLTRLWPLQATVSRRHAEEALPALVDPLVDAGVLGVDGDQVRALIDVRPYATEDLDAWIVSDLTPGMDGRIDQVRPDYVLGVSSASSSLAQLTSRRPVGRALDLGTGCGVQALHLAAHCDQVVGTDLNPRALQHADLTARLNGVGVDLRAGSLYDPVHGDRFDLITSNPPYVMSPPDDDRLTYREGTQVADQLVQQVITEGAAHLRPGGTLQVLANWAHVGSTPWDERLETWIAPTGCDAHVVQREVLGAEEYVELWLADAGLVGSASYAARYTAWLDYFAALDITAVGMGWLTLRHNDRAAPDRHYERWPHAIEQPIGPAIDARADAVDRLAGLGPAELLGRTWLIGDDVVEESFGTPGMADPHHLVLRQHRGFRRAVETDTALAAVLGACDGELTLAQIVGGVATLLEVDTSTLAAEIVARIPDLVRDGLLGEADAGHDAGHNDRQDGQAA